MENTYSTLLPSGNLVIVCQVKDQLGAYSNFTANLTVETNVRYVYS